MERSNPCHSDCDGHALGETDCDGYEVGFIDDGGLGWESLRERDVAITVGRFHDACLPALRAGGVGALPDPGTFARRNCLDPDSIPEAIEACHDALDPENPVNQLIAAYHAALARFN